MSFHCGIVGLPNVGKSTIFNALTSAKAEAANFPFCTIDPNTGIVKVPDPRLDEITKLIKTKAIAIMILTALGLAFLAPDCCRTTNLGAGASPSPYSLSENPFD